jgi:hypothetical protein
LYTGVVQQVRHDGRRAHVDRDAERVLPGNGDGRHGRIERKRPGRGRVRPGVRIHAHEDAAGVEAMVLGDGHREIAVDARLAGKDRLGRRALADLDLALAARAVAAADTREVHAGQARSLQERRAAGHLDLEARRLEADVARNGACVSHAQLRQTS